MKFKLISSILVVCLSLPTHVFAHSGGTNSDGCHNDNINGGYHCHNAKRSSGGGGGVLLAVLVVGAAYWYFSTPELNLKNNYKPDPTDKLKNRFKFSLAPTSTTEIDGVILQMSYAF